MTVDIRDGMTIIPDSRGFPARLGRSRVVKVRFPQVSVREVLGTRIPGAGLGGFSGAVYRTAPLEKATLKSPFTLLFLSFFSLSLFLPVNMGWRNYLLIL